jgi:steroid 5-alpha reductase family enzyme
MTPYGSLVALGLALALAMTGAWWIATKSGKSGWIDAIWSFAVGICGAVAAVASIGGAGPTDRQVLVAVLALLWSLRLGLHIAVRTAQSDQDDPRYAQLRREWGRSFRRRLFFFLQIQAATAFALVLSIMAAAHNPAPGFSPQDWVGILLLLVAVAGEAVADRQLVTFRSDPANKGKVCDIGLWRLSRHPNYFFEWLGWLAYPVIAVDLAGGYQWGWAALVGPVLMYWLLVHASGIPPLEAHMLRSRGERFRRYQEQTNAFWPGPPHTATNFQGNRL